MRVLLLCLGALALPAARADEPGDLLAAALRARVAAERAAALDRLRAEDASGPDGVRLADRVGRVLAGDPHGAVRAAAARALGRLGGRGTTEALLAAGNGDPDPDVADASAAALGRLAGADEVGTLLRTVGGGAVRGRALSATALGQTGDLRARPVLRRVLVEDAEWVVRASAALALGEGAEAADIAALAARAGPEADPAAWAACAEALEIATGQRLGPDPVAWQRAAAAGGLVPASAPERAAAEPGHTVEVDRLARWTITYWGIPVREDGVLFCVDASVSMNFYDRLPDARRELRATVARLPRALRFSACFFNDRIEWWRPRLVRASPLAKSALFAALDDLQARGYTDLLGTIERALGLGGLGRYPVREPEPVRALFLLTDGLPSKQYITDPATIRRAVAAWNPGGRIAVHAIALGLADTELLQGLAADNRGQFVKRGR